MAPETGWLDGPRYGDAELWDTVGYVQSIRTEQEGTRHALFFTLRICRDTAIGLRWREQKFYVYLDVSTTVALTQLQLLRDAMWSRSLKEPYLVRVHFNFQDDTGEYAHPYWVEVMLRDEVFPVTVEQFYQAEYGLIPEGWKTHIDRG